MQRAGRDWATEQQHRLAHGGTLNILQQRLHIRLQNKLLHNFKKADFTSYIFSSHNSKESITGGNLETVIHVEIKHIPQQPMG